MNFNEVVDAFVGNDIHGDHGDVCLTKRGIASRPVFYRSSGLDSVCFLSKRDTIDALSWMSISYQFTTIELTL